MAMPYFQNGRIKMIHSTAKQGNNGPQLARQRRENVMIIYIRGDRGNMVHGAK